MTAAATAEEEEKEEKEEKEEALDFAHSEIKKTKRRPSKERPHHKQPLEEPNE